MNLIELRNLHVSSNSRLSLAPVSLISLAFSLLIYGSFTIAADIEPWKLKNTEQLLNRIGTATKLPLEMSEIDLQLTNFDGEIGVVSSVAVGNDGLFYLLQRNIEVDPVIVINNDGEILRTWGKGLYAIPHSIRIDPDGNVWTVDAGNSQIYKFSPEGKELLHIDVGEIPEIKSRFKGTADIAFASDGNVLIADGYGNARVLEYDQKGQRIREWGSAGTGPSEFKIAHAITIDDNDIIYVGDRENGRIQRFDRNGKFLGIWDGLGRVFSLFFDGELIWAGITRLDLPGGSGGFVMQINRESGDVVGIVSAPAVHSVTVTKTGEFLSGLRPNRVIWFQHIQDK